MKQKISTRAIVKQDGKVLLLRRSKGRSEIVDKYELPGGEVEFAEDPKDALKRIVREQTSTQVETAQLFDVISYSDPDNADTRHLAIVYLASLSPTERNIELSSKHNKFVWEKLPYLQLNDITNITALALKITENIALEQRPEILKTDAKKSADHSYLIIYGDGGSRGNPGPSAAGFVIMDAHESVFFEGGKYLGITTNNQAEYQAVYLALEKAKELGARVVEFRLDSLLVVNQLNGIYKIKNRDLWPIHASIRELAKEFHKVTFTHIRREFNRLADGMVNKVLDEHGH
jgi:ribonuclease HI/ADP-ribose pyrophosphatase YjhB (NUDIX family)